MKNEEILKQLDKVTEAMHTCAILKDLNSKYELSLEILRLGQLTELKQEKVDKLREEFGLTSVVWILAELEIEKGEK